MDHVAKFVIWLTLQIGGNPACGADWLATFCILEVPPNPLQFRGAIMAALPRSQQNFASAGLPTGFYHVFRRMLGRGVELHAAQPRTLEPMQDELGRALNRASKNVKFPVGPDLSWR